MVRKNKKRQRVEEYVYYSGPITSRGVASEFKITAKMAGMIMTQSPDLIKVERYKDPITHTYTMLWGHLGTYSLDDMRDLYFAKHIDKRSFRKMNSYISRHPELESIVEEK